MEQLTDTSPMPFGKYGPKQGDPRILQDVPASYLIYLWDNGIYNEPQKPIHHYIKNSFNALLQDCKDYIPEHRP